MDADFWKARWESNQIGFHEGKPNAYLERHLDKLALPAGARVFLPLCGKTRDIGWLLSRGLRVAGAELSPIAVGQLFEELGVVPQITQEGSLARYAAGGLDIFLGDVFALTAEALGTVDAVYDRAALVALPPPMRARYVPHVAALSGGVPQLLVSYVYDQSQADGPPFSVAPDEVRALYGEFYAVSQIDGAELPGGLRGKLDASEHVWLMEAA